jgi:hypothetical protein
MKSNTFTRVAASFEHLRAVSNKPTLFMEQAGLDSASATIRDDDVLCLGAKRVSMPCCDYERDIYRHKGQTWEFAGDVLYSIWRSRFLSRAKFINKKEREREPKRVQMNKHMPMTQKKNKFTKVLKG